MSWSPILPATRYSGHGNHKPAATASITLGRSDLPRMNLVFRPAHMDQPPSWLAPGALVDAMEGFGEHAGMIRIVPGRSYKVGQTGGRGTNIPMLVLRVPAQFAPTKRAVMAIECDWHDDWVEVSLPADWRAAPKGEPTAPAPSPRLLTDKVSSHPAWASPKGRAAHAASVKGG